MLATVYDFFKHVLIFCQKWKNAREHFFGEHFANSASTKSWKIFFSNFNEKFKGWSKKTKKLKEIQMCPHEISQEEIKKVLQS
jgi:hypothetical protein